MQGRLNAIQKSMLLWNEMHPYSAVHVVQMRAPLDVMRLRTCINGAVTKHGLTRLSLDCAQSAFQYEGGPADCEIRTLPSDEGPCSALRTEIERQLNLPFDHTRPFSPFRFLVAPAGESFFLGLAYFHPAADATSVVRLLKEIITAYLQTGAADSNQALDLYPDHRAHLLRRHPQVVARRVLGLPAQIRNLRQSHRARFADPNNMANGFECFSVAPPDLRSLLAAAKNWGVTVNDLLIALLMKSLSPCAAGRAQARRRKKLSVGCIVNLRRDQGPARRQAFGVFLGSFTVTHEAPEGIGLRALAADIRKQTAPIKRHRLYLGMPLELGLARFLLKFLPPERRKTFYAKSHPLWGGITNMNLNGLWEPAGGPAPLDYFRGVSTGPITPLVLSVTTIGERLNLGLSYRTAVFSKREIQNLQGRFLEELKETRPAA
jgi:hypothetical protein